MKPRDLSAVIDELLTVIPADEVDLRDKLERVKENLFFTAPEAHFRLWRLAGLTLHERIGDEAPTDGWMKQLVEIWNPEFKK